MSDEGSTHFVTDPVEFDAEWALISSAVDLSRYLAQGVFKATPIATFFTKFGGFQESRLLADLEDFTGRIGQPGFRVAMLENPYWYFNRNQRFQMLKFDGGNTLEEFDSAMNAGPVPIAVCASDVTIYPRSLDWVAYGSYDFDLFLIGLYRKEQIAVFDASMTRSSRCSVEGTLEFIPKWARVEVDREEFFRRYNPRDFGAVGY